MENHIKQNDEECLIPIQNIGCFFRSCGLIAEMQTGKRLTAAQINDAWKWSKEAKRIDEEDNVVNSASISTRFLRVLGDNGRFYEIGTFQEGKCNFYPSVSEDFRHPDFFIQKIFQSGPSKTHFRVVDKYGDLVEDPHEPPIKVKAIVYTIMYKYIPGEN